MVEITSEEQNKVKRMERTEESLSDFRDDIKCTNIRIIGVPEEEEKKKEYQKIFEEIIVENSPSMKRKYTIKSKRNRVPYMINPRRNTPKHILIKLAKTNHKTRLLKAAREKKQVTYKRHPIHLTGNLSAETLQARSKWQDIFKELKGKNLQPRLQYPARISFKTDGEIKAFQRSQS